MVKKKKKTKRIILVFMLCLAVNTYIFYSLGSIVYDVVSKKQESKKLIVKLDNLKEEGESLRVEANKLKNPDYVAKYAREKYLYTKNNEYDIRIK